MNEKEIQVIDFAYLRMCAEHDYIYETGEAKLLLNYITNLQQENARLKDNYKRLEKFICYEQDRLLKATSHTYQDSFDKIKFVNSDIFEELKKVENKMKELLKEN